MMIRIFMIALLILNGCSMLPPTKKEFENNLKSLIGSKERGFQGQKIIINKNEKEWYYSNLKTQCKHIIITDLNDTITEFKILTPNTCKSGYPAVW